MLFVCHFFNLRPAWRVLRSRLTGFFNFFVKKSDLPPKNA
nr:MAG TPA: hypothetical protein [Caudoviricetes sp.]